MSDLALISRGLLSKWGFHDGDILDDYCWDHDIPADDKDLHVALRQLVREHLLPKLAEHHQIEVYDIETRHNPIRASMVDGQEINDYTEQFISLTPEWISIPLAVVAAAVEQAVKS